MKCFKCGSEMVVRKAKEGRFAGREFYGCSRYPDCTATVHRIPKSPNFIVKQLPENNNKQDSNASSCTSCNGTGYRLIKLNPHSRKQVQQATCNNCSGRGWIKAMDITGRGL
jgi:ssDNA-binding Zn-finger/Zn-ribbon topoisomerase 1